MGKAAAAAADDDATLAENVKEENSRTSEQLEYFGGDTDSLDSEDFSAADRGDAIAEEPADEAKEETDDDESEDADSKAGDEAEDADESADDDDSDDESADADDEDDSEPEDDSDGDEVDAESDTDAKNDHGIPRHRFNEVNERMKTAEAEIASLKKTQQAETVIPDAPFDFDAAEKEYMGLLLDGKVDDAGDKRREIRTAEKAEFTAVAKQETKAEVNADSMQNTVTDLATQAEEMFPVFKQGHEKYDPAMVSKTTTFMRGYQADGMNPDDALVAAIADVAEMYGLMETESEDTQDEVTPKPKKGKPINKTKEKLKLAEQQGKSPAGEGKGSSEHGAAVPDIEQMSDEQIDALPAETLARIRGDYIE